MKLPEPLERLKNQLTYGRNKKRKRFIVPPATVEYVLSPQEMREREKQLSADDAIEAARNDPKK